MFNITSDKLYENVAHDFSSVYPYQVGNYCYHDGYLYRCATATTGAWDESKWIKTRLTDELSSVASTGVQKVNGKTGIVTLDGTEIPLSDSSGSVESDLLTRAKSTAVANEFSTSTTYAANALVMHNNILYKAKENIPAGTWDASKWQTTAIANELGGGGGSVNSVNGKTGTVVLNGTDIKVEDSTTSVSIKDAFDNVQFALNNVYTKSDTYSKSETNSLLAQKVNDIAITDEFSASTAYTAGTYVMHNGDFYKAKVDMAAGSWNASKWEMKKITDIIGGGGSVDLTCIAPEYSETAIYVANDIVLHNNKVYYCAKKSASGPWTASEWIECPISKLLIYDALSPIWSTERTYSSGEWCTYRGHLYVCIVETSTEGTFVDDEWYKISIDKTLNTMVHSIINWTAPWFTEYDNYEKNSYVMHLSDPIDISSAALYKAKTNIEAGEWNEENWEYTTLVAMRDDLVYQKSITRNVWSENGAYYLGDVVMYKGKLCKAVVDETTAGSFLNEEWDFTDTFTELNLEIGNRYVKNAGKTYNVGDIVQANNGLYQAQDTVEDTEPFKPVISTSEEANLIAEQIQDVGYAMVLTSEQQNLLLNTCMSKGEADIKYVGTVAGTDINETVTCVYSSGSYPTFIGELSNGWNIFATAMTPESVLLGIGEDATVLIAEGDSADVTIISNDIIWKQVHVEHTPIDHDVVAATFVSTEEYSNGDCVMHGDNLYKANKDVSAGAWDESDWDETNIFAEKQDKLTAGENITIDNNVISANTDKPFVLIETVTTTETGHFIRTNEPDGTPYEFDGIYVELENETTKMGSWNSYSIHASATSSYTAYIIGRSYSQDSLKEKILCKIENSLWRLEIFNVNSENWTSSAPYQMLNIKTEYTDKIRKFQFNTIPEGTTIKIYAIK